MAKRKWRVVWTEAATQDLAEIVSFVARKSPVNARRLLLELRSRADSLESPERGRPVSELESTGTRVWRELVVKPHLIVYRMAGATSSVAREPSAFEGPARSCSIAVSSRRERHGDASKPIKHIMSSFLARRPRMATGAAGDRPGR
jgi:plasmid stabilization system protein ParE